MPAVTTCRSCHWSKSLSELQCSYLVINGTTPIAKAAVQVREDAASARPPSWHTLKKWSAKETGAAGTAGIPQDTRASAPTPGTRGSRAATSEHWDGGSCFRDLIHRAPRNETPPCNCVAYCSNCVQGCRWPRLNPSATWAHGTRHTRSPAHSRPVTLWTGCARGRAACRGGNGGGGGRGRARPGAEGRQGAVARLRAAAGWNRYGRKWGRCLGFRSDAPRARPGGTGENNKMAAGGGVFWCPWARGSHKERRSLLDPADARSGMREMGLAVPLSGPRPRLACPGTRATALGRGARALGVAEGHCGAFAWSRRPCIPVTVLGFCGCFVFVFLLWGCWGFLSQRLQLSAN